MTQQRLDAAHDQVTAALNELADALAEFEIETGQAPLRPDGIGPEQLREIRAAAGYGHHGGMAEFSRILGYKSPDGYRQYEKRGNKPVPRLLQLTMWMINRYGVPVEWLNRDT